MEYTIALDPKLGMSAADFIEAWQASEHSGQGQARLDQSSGGTHFPLAYTAAILTVGGTLAVELITAVDVDWLTYHREREAKPTVTTTTISTPDGTPVLIIKQETE
jgi:hypothetical protein